MNVIRWLSRVAGRGEAVSVNPDDLVALGETDGEPIAELWRNLLEQRGIRTLVRNVGPHVHMAIPFRVYVLRRDLEEAREILGLGSTESTL